MKRRQENQTFAAFALLFLLGVALAVAFGDADEPGGRLRMALTQPGPAQAMAVQP